MSSTLNILKNRLAVRTCFLLLSYLKREKLSFSEQCPINGTMSDANPITGIKTRFDTLDIEVTTSLICNTPYSNQCIEDLAISPWYHLSQSLPAPFVLCWLAILSGLDFSFLSCPSHLSYSCSSSLEYRGIKDQAKGVFRY